MAEPEESIRRELDAMRVASAALGTLTPAERDRAMDWLLAGWRDESKQRQTKPTPATPTQDR